MSSKINLEEYQKRLSEATNTIVPISEYVGWYKPITYKCIVCNHEWEAKEARSAIRYVSDPSLRRTGYTTLATF